MVARARNEHSPYDKAITERPVRLLFAVASTRAGLRTGPGLWLWLAGSGFAFFMTFLGWPMLVALGLFISGCGQIWVGCSARCERPALRRVSRPEAPVAAR